MSVRLVHVVIESEGQLCMLIIPPGRKELALRLLQSVFDDGTLAAVKLPPEYHLSTLGEES
jgi:hypothetical protein